MGIVIEECRKIADQGRLWRGFRSGVYPTAINLSQVLGGSNILNEG
jgi:hypothetical protein